MSNVRAPRACGAVIRNGLWGLRLDVGAGIFATVRVSAFVLRVVGTSPG